jgi:hypothetical protein
LRLTAIAGLVVVAVLGTYYLVAFEPSTPTVSVTPAPADQRAPTQDVVLAGPNTLTEPIEPSASPEDRATTVVNAMSESVARGPHIDALVKTGLARSDAERIVGEFAHGIAACLLEEAAKDSEARGYTREEFLHAAEMFWATPGSGFDLQHLPSGAAPCVTNVSQQAGLPMAVGFEPRSLRPGAPVDVPAGRADSPDLEAAEAAIRSHIAKYPAFSLSDLFVHCEARGCEILMRGEGLRPFELEFDRFAEDNGFRYAVLGGDEALRTVWLQR